MEWKVRMGIGFLCASIHVLVWFSGKQGVNQSQNREKGEERVEGGREGEREKERRREREGGSKQKLLWLALVYTISLTPLPDAAAF